MAGCRATPSTNWSAPAERSGDGSLDSRTTDLKRCLPMNRDCPRTPKKGLTSAVRSRLVITFLFGSRLTTTGRTALRH